jgi:H+/Cl- antiporter ClcA
MNSEGAVIRALMNDKIEDTLLNVLQFTAVWYVLFITTQGVTVPAGLFLPGMIIGSGLGFCIHGVMGIINPN